MNSCCYLIHFRAFVKWSLDLEIETCIPTVLPAGLFLISGVCLIPRYGKWMSNYISSITWQTSACWENLLWMLVYAIYSNTGFVKHFVTRSLILSTSSRITDSLLKLLHLIIISGLFEDWICRCELSMALSFHTHNRLAYIPYFFSNGFG